MFPPGGRSDGGGMRRSWQRFYGEALAAGAEAFLTGEVKHHEWFMAAEQGLCLMAAGHHATEHPAMPQLAKQLRTALPGLPVEVFDSDPARWGGI